jgi:hypothetical protein
MWSSVNSELFRWFQPLTIRTTCTSSNACSCVTAQWTLASSSSPYMLVNPSVSAMTRSTRAAVFGSPARGHGLVWWSIQKVLSRPPQPVNDNRTVVIA